MMTPTILSLGIFLCGFLVGFVVANVCVRKAKKSSLDCGEIIVNTTDPMKDVLKFALDIPVAELMSADKVTFQVMREDS